MRVLLLYIRSVICLSLAILVTSLTGCANSPFTEKVEKSLAPDPKLKDNPNVFAAKSIVQERKQATKISSKLPVDFPKQLKYPNALLKEVIPTEGPASNLLTRWSSSDPSNIINSFYLNQLQQNGWQILQQPKADEIPATIVAQLNYTTVKISTTPQLVTNKQINQEQANQEQANPKKTSQPKNNTELLIEYTNNSRSIVKNNTENTGNTQNTPPQPGSPDFIGPVANNTEISKSPENSENQELENNSQAATNPTPDFNDFSKIPSEQREQIQDLVRLGVLKINFDINPNNNKSTSDSLTNNSPTNNSPTNNPTANKFDPAKNITRREYARWLIAAYNVMYANNPTKQIRLASASAKPVFRDVAKTDPDFGAIQGLAEAGIIPSSLSGDSTQVLFQPNSPLNRENLILWKLPLDTRTALPTANLESVRQTWGFQDVAKINSKALRAVLADFQNGEKANIRRVFGYTTLFQPKKPVTRAEAATALWYFGTEGEGVSAQDALKSKQFEMGN